MPSYALITPERFRDRRWRRYRAMPFAAAETAVPLAAAELPRAMMHLPVAFTAVDGEDGVAPVAVLGVTAQRNELVSPEGKWFGGYIPAVFRGYPFALQRAGDDRLMLCIDESAGLVGEEGERFYDEAGEPAPETRRVLDFLVKLEAGYRGARQQAALLGEHGLLSPWQPTVTVAGQRIALGGLQRVDEGALNALAPDALAALRDVGALAMAYAHLYSLQHLARLVTLAERRQQSAGAEASIEELFGDDEEVLSFDL